MKGWNKSLKAAVEALEVESFPSIHSVQQGRSQSFVLPGFVQKDLLADLLSAYRWIQYLEHLRIKVMVQ